MRTKDIPEEEATKLRLIRELPYAMQVPVDRIISDAKDWPHALYGIDKLLTSIVQGIDSIKSVRGRFKLIGPVGDMRRMKR